MIVRMLARILRLTDRVGRLVVKLFAWVGARLERLFGPAPVWYAAPTRPTAARDDIQISSLSGLIVLLLAAFVTILLWAGNARSDNPIVRLLAVNGGGAPETFSSAAPEVSDAPPDREFLASGGTVVFSMIAGAQEDLFAIVPGQLEPLRLTAHPEDDRDPTWNPQGDRIAFASRRDGNWELYVLDITSGQMVRLTYNLAYEANPTWSPDGQWLAYEAYYQGNLDIYVIRADASEGPYPVTTHPAPDFSPAWTAETSGRQLAFVSLRGGDQDIYLISLDDPSEERVQNLTATPTVNESDPAWSPDGTLIAYSAVENGISLVYARSLSGGAPVAVGQGRQPTWSPDGGSLVFITDRAEGSLLLSGQFGSWTTSVQAFQLEAAAASPHWAPVRLPDTLPGELGAAAVTPIEPAYEEVAAIQENGDAPYLLYSLPGVVADSPYLSDRVDDSFAALREHINRAAGWDVLGRLDDTWWAIDRPAEPGQDARSWHKAGRAFALAQAFNQGSPPQIEVVPRQVGPDMYWDVYVRASVQDGSLGEPLHARPWDFAARASGDIAAYEAGGRLKDSIPPGYYVNFTRAAAMFGWQPVAADSSWRYNWPGVRWWQYEKRDGLDWWSAMLEIYSEERLREVFGPS
ncbi:MAG: hypothetical protein Kow00124_02940 [Anaerolineae bacterium]